MEYNEDRKKAIVLSKMESIETLLNVVSGAEGRIEWEYREEI